MISFSKKITGVKTACTYWFCNFKLWQILLWRSGKGNIWFLLEWFCWLVCICLDVFYVHFDSTLDDFRTNFGYVEGICRWWFSSLSCLDFEKCYLIFHFNAVLRYIEASKARLYQSGDNTVASTAQAVLLYTFENILTMLHPFMPFVTEELWQVNVTVWVLFLGYLYGASINLYICLFKLLYSFVILCSHK